MNEKENEMKTEETAEETVKEAVKEAVEETVINADSDGECTPQSDSEECECTESEECADEKKHGRKDEKKYKAKAAALEKKAADAEAKLSEMNDKYLRVAAEYENFRKRSQKEKEGIYSDAVSDTVKELLPLFDNLERASSFTEGDKVGEGLALILKTIPDVLSKIKVESFGEKGDSFDPNIHNAIMHEENEEYGENEIVEVFQKGYRIGEKIIRHALVKVAN